MCNGGDTTSVTVTNDAESHGSYARRMNMRLLTPVVAALSLAFIVPLAGASASASLSPDQRFVAGLKDARKASQVAFQQLTPWNISIDKVNKAKSEIAGALVHLRKASQAAPGAIGGSDAEIAASLRASTGLVAQASEDLRMGAYDRARKDVDLAIDATDEALAKFGVPLAKEFQATATYRELGNIQGWEEYLGLSARVNAPISKIVIGILGRPTANMGEAGAKKSAPSLPITKLAIYTLQEPSGAYSSGWGKIVNGVIVADLDPTMKASETFAVSFGPRVAKGTKFLVKFWSTDGRRSYAVLTTK